MIWIFEAIGIFLINAVVLFIFLPLFISIGFLATKKLDSNYPFIIAKAALGLFLFSIVGMLLKAQSLEIYGQLGNIAILGTVIVCLILMLRAVRAIAPFD